MMGKIGKASIYLLTNTKLKIPKEKGNLLYNICTFGGKKNSFSAKKETINNF